jgi:hypothetical protein
MFRLWFTWMCNISGNCDGYAPGRRLNALTVEIYHKLYEPLTAQGKIQDPRFEIWKHL